MNNRSPISVPTYWFNMGAYIGTQYLLTGRLLLKKKKKQGFLSVVAPLWRGVSTRGQEETQVYPMEGRSQLLSADLCCILRVFQPILDFFIVENSKSAAISPFMERIGRNSGVKLLSASPLKWRGLFLVFLTVCLFVRTQQQTLINLCFFRPFFYKWSVPA